MIIGVPKEIKDHEFRVGLTPDGTRALVKGGHRVLGIEPSLTAKLAELGTTPRGLIAGQEGLLKLIFHSGTGVLLGVHAICEIASEITGTGQAMIHNQATIEDVVRMAYNTPTYTYGYRLAAADALARLHPDVLRAMRLPSRAHRI